ncbi:phage holin family protein [Tropicimonas isoalkanivorans]|uniref:Putative Holin-X, holin superfamily III n=1 Tax=Tropicimonas isoalkanivorans TaxID=441112 RepID=A0A1I1EJR1_9RHOB|nr:phage holin family protein [Tropicimonas isoalkanivorans]SFB85133.1 Putative Holin-X, holin superfamily III [Tropicimonas isoalkanivorans]
MNERPATEGTTTLIGEALTSVASLVRSEVDLARAEIDQNLRSAGMALGMIAAAVILALTALNVLAAAIAAGLANLGIDAGWAALIVGLAFGLLAWVLLNRGLNNLKLSSLAPTRTAENVKRDARAVKGATNAN